MFEFYKRCLREALQRIDYTKHPEVRHVELRETNATDGTVFQVIVNQGEKKFLVSIEECE